MYVSHIREKNPVVNPFSIADKQFVLLYPLQKNSLLNAFRVRNFSKTNAVGDICGQPGQEGHLRGQRPLRQDRPGHCPGGRGDH